MDLYYRNDTYSWETGRAHRYPAENARARALGILGESDYEDRISLFYLDSPADMAGLFGESVVGRADPLGNAVALVLDEDVTERLRHEVMHVVSWGVWGAARMPYGWISEGLAVFAQGEYRGHDLHRLAHLLDQEGRLLPVDTLVNGFWEQEETLSYLQAGSLVRYIHEAYGFEVLKGLWQHGVGRVVELTGVALSQLDADWRLYIAGTIDAPAGFKRLTGR